MSFALSKKALERVEWLRTRYPDERALILPVLHMAQRENNGWVSPEVIRVVAEVVGVPLMWVHEVTSFYTQYNLKPIGRHHIQVCTNLCCSLVGGERVYDYISERLGISGGETTPDGKFHLTRVECLGACGYGPMMQINDTFYEHLTFSKIDAILAELAASPDLDEVPNLFVGPGTGGHRVHPKELFDDGIERVRNREMVHSPEHAHGEHEPLPPRPTVLGSEGGAP